ncbi:hypothetical protein I317_01689 [Kwoniella heveanensis CBS 569]|nr:hypothetical protein I317_01689 [Kwoniella heveanensis CBS 569]
MLAIFFFHLFALLASPVLSLPLDSSPSALESRATKYDAKAMSTALSRGQGILGSMCSWMSKVADSTKVTDLSIPGTHDTASWNYTPLTQIKYLGLTKLIYPSPVYRCQKSSIFGQLASGIRAFDLRVGPSPKNSSELIFFHSEAVLDTSARFEDVMYGFYRFLDENPTESLFVSIKIENTTFGTDGFAQQSLYTTLTSSAAQSYVNPTTSISSLALSSIRGKIVLLRRFSVDQVSPQPSAGLGLNLVDGWADNSAAFSINYASNEVAYIEDLYEPDAPTGITNHVNVKLNATVTNIAAAARKSKGDGLYISFASGEKAVELIVPEILAQGLIVPGVNQGLKKWLTTGAGTGLKKKGLVFLDFATETSGLISAIIA